MPSSGARIVVRADGCEAIGGGHLTRCRSLSHALRRLGAAVRFVVSEESAAQAAAIADDGFDVRTIAGGPLEALAARDADETVAAAHEWGAAAVLVDHYGAGPEHFATLREGVGLVGAIDDLGDRDLRGVGWILNQNLAAEAALYGPADGRTVLLGTAYALLRPQFERARATLDRSFASDDARVLVTFGAGAPASLYAIAVSELAGVGRRLEVRVLLGRDEAPDDALVRIAAASPHDVRLLGRLEDVAPEIAWADVVLSAGGSTCWELLALGAPAAVAALSRDQEPNAAALAAARCAVAVAPDLAGAGAAVEDLLSHPAIRARASRHGRTLVDGRGAERAAASLLETIAKEPLRDVA
jgi:spore coat polysaccharide biosynthesis predicted glycosyltransferase SpsG